MTVNVGRNPFPLDSAKTAQALSLWHQLGLIQTPDPDSCLATRRTTANDHSHRQSRSTAKRCAAATSSFL